jgi:hypothetical protein
MRSIRDPETLRLGRESTGSTRYETAPYLGMSGQTYGEAAMT